jgi:hypothetical protein
MTAMRAFQHPIAPKFDHFCSRHRLAPHLCAIFCPFVPCRAFKDRNFSVKHGISSGIAPR